MTVRKWSAFLGLPLGVWLLACAYLTLRDHHYSIFGPDIVGALLSIFGDSAAVYGGATVLGLLGLLCLAIPI
jgi:MFS-type transporter involved in bile tolerance (Atg22 family)